MNLLTYLLNFDYNAAKPLRLPVTLDINRTTKRREYPYVSFSRSGYRPFINPPPSIGNLLLDITLCSISFRCRFVFVVVNFRVTVRVRVSYRVRVRVRVRDR